MNSFVTKLMIVVAFLNLVIGLLLLSDGNLFGIVNLTGGAIQLILVANFADFGD